MATDFDPTAQDPRDDARAARTPAGVNDPEAAEPTTTPQAGSADGAQAPATERLNPYQDVEPDESPNGS